ncbi:MAG: site-specific integrase [Zoogloea sp.]|nr:site-specific integrase [Zoogloea sp.]
MASIRQRIDTGNLFFDLRWDGKRYRAQTELADTPENRASLEPKLRLLNEAIKRGRFDLAAFFPELTPGSTPAPVSTAPAREDGLQRAAAAVATPLFTTFADQWFSEFKIGWRRTYTTTVRGILDGHLLPRFGTLAIGAVTRAQILEFRSHLAGVRGRRPGTKLSPARINTIMLILRQILQESADRYEFTMPMGRLKPLKVPKSDVQPFTLEQVQLLINSIRKDYKNYLTVRFFTGLRSGEINGLKWKYVDFERRLILVRETIVGGHEEYTKNDFSQREVIMDGLTYEALQAQHKATGKMEYVFCNRAGEPVDTANFTKRVWYPLLRHLGLALRRPYQTRHTAATLWLAAGESPSWIAATLGHNSTEMLHRVYSRYVPNLTRRDGSAFDRLLHATFKPKANDDGTTPPAQPPPVRALIAAAA